MMRLGLGITRARGGDPLPGLFSGGVLLDQFGAPYQFQTTTNATPATADTNPVGLWLDRSAGLALGSELVVNGGFDSDTVWSKTAGWTIAGGVATGVSTDSFRSLWQTGICPTGRLFDVALTVPSITGSVTTRLGTNVGGNQIGSIAAPSTYAFRGISNVSLGDGQDLYVVTSTDTTVVVDNVSCREVQGRHGYQGASTSFRPTRTGSGTAINLDGSDDRLNTLHVPGAAGTLIARVTPNASATNRIIMGSRTSSGVNGAFLGIDGSGRIAAGIGSEGLTAIFGGSDIRGTTGTAAVTWDGTTVNLYWNGVSVYSEAQSGSVAGAAPIDLGCLNTAGARSSFYQGTARAFGAVPRALTASEILTVHNRWSA